MPSKHAMMLRLELRACCACEAALDELLERAAGLGLLASAVAGGKHHVILLLESESEARLWAFYAETAAKPLAEVDHVHLDEQARPCLVPPHVPRKVGWLMLDAWERLAPEPEEERICGYVVLAVAGRDPLRSMMALRVRLRAEATKTASRGDDALLHLMASARNREHLVLRVSASNLRAFTSLLLDLGALPDATLAQSYVSLVERRGAPDGERASADARSRILEFLFQSPDEWIRASVILKGAGLTGNAGYKRLEDLAAESMLERQRRVDGVFYRLPGTRDPSGQVEA